MTVLEYVGEVLKYLICKHIWYGAHNNCICNHGIDFMLQARVTLLCRGKNFNAKKFLFFVIVMRTRSK